MSLNPMHAELFPLGTQTTEMKHHRRIIDLAPDGPVNRLVSRALPIEQHAIPAAPLPNRTGAKDTMHGLRSLPS